MANRTVNNAVPEGGKIMNHKVEQGWGHLAHHGCGGEEHHSHDCFCAPCREPVDTPTREEAIRRLEEYLTYLKAEIKGVEQRLAELQKEQV